MFYFVKTPRLLKKAYPGIIWDMPSESSPCVYLTFDDGPTPSVTEEVLDILSEYQALGTFFCLGKNVMQHYDVYQKVIDQNHQTGNHTFHHLNGFKTSDNHYLDDIKKAADIISSNLFRPPYGRIKKSQIKKLSAHYQIIMWSILSGDFDKNASPQKIFNHVANHLFNGAIITFHDSEKAATKLIPALPKILKHISEEGYQFKKINL